MKFGRFVSLGIEWVLCSVLILVNGLVILWVFMIWLVLLMVRVWLWKVYIWCVGRLMME